MLSAKLGFGYATTALLAAHGQYGHSAKWKAKRFREVQPATLPFEDYWHMETMRSYDPDDPAAWVAEVLLTCRAIAESVKSPG